MHSGKDVTNYPTQWALNPTAYQNIDSSQVDWATLAQQWIAMKEAAIIPPPPPPPPEVDHGEAPMEVENTDSQTEVASIPQNLDWDSNSNSWGSWNQWGWGWPGAAPLDPKIPPEPGIGQPLIDGYVEPTAAAVVPGYSTSAGPGSSFQHGYWTAPQTEQNSSEFKTNDLKKPRIMNKDKPPRQQRLHREKMPMMPAMMDPMMMHPGFPTTTLDAAKRRQLPAWIREGLEKMEKEKQKALEREQEQKAKEQMEMERKKAEEEELLRLKAEADGNPLPPPKSKFESESEHEGSDKEEEDKDKEETVEEAKQVDGQQSPLVKKTKEEIMQEVMVAVRRSLTEILLEVTDHELQTVAREELARYNTAQATRVNVMKASKSKALAAITSGLGLGAYESSSGESDQDEDDLSDHHLQEMIKRRRVEWEAKEREIEAEVSPRRPTTPTTPRTPRSSMTPPPIDTGNKEKRKEHCNEKNKHAEHDKSKKNYVDSTPSPKKSTNNKSSSSDSSSSDSDSSSESSTSKSSYESKTKKVSAKKNKKSKNRSPSSGECEPSSKKNNIHKEKERKSKKHADKTAKSKRDNGEEKYKNSRGKENEKMRKDKYDDDYRVHKRRRSRTPSYESRSSRRKNSRDRDRSEDRYHKREKRSYDRDRSYDRYSRDKYERSREYDRRRSRSGSHHRHRR